MKIIRASRDIYVPVNPEDPDKNSLRPVHKNLIAIVPEDFLLPEDSYVDLGKFNLKKSEKKQ